MTALYALDLRLPFETDFRGITERECDLTKLHQFRVHSELIPSSMHKFLAEQEIYISHAEAFYTPARQLLPIHSDGVWPNTMTKLNFCWGGAGSKMLWWKLKPYVEPVLLTTKIGTQYSTMNAKDCITIASHTIKLPTLVNVGQPHSVFNMGSEGRWVLSLVLYDVKTNIALRWDEAFLRLKRLELTP